MSRVRALLALVVAGAVLAGPVAGALASNASLLDTVSSHIGKLTKDESRVLAGLSAYENHKGAGAAIRAMRREERDLKSLTKTLSRDSASTSAGRTGKAQVIKGLNLIAKAYGQLASELGKVSSGTAVPVAKIKATERTAKTGKKDLAKGLKLLGAK